MDGEVSVKNIVRALRRSAEFDITQQELADAVGVDRTTIAKIERGRPPTGPVMLRICRFFGKAPHEVFYDDYVVSTLQDVLRRRERRKAKNDRSRSKSPSSRDMGAIHTPRERPNAPGIG
jgi:putative transcriptional regulator